MNEFAKNLTPSPNQPTKVKARQNVQLIVNKLNQNKNLNNNTKANLKKYGLTEVSKTQGYK